MKIFNFIRSRLRKFINEERWLEDHIKAGMKVGKNCDIQAGLIVDHSHCWLIEIGNNVTIAPQVYLLAHDASLKKKINFSKIGNIIIKDNCFIGARAILMPGVTIGENSIINNKALIEHDVKIGSNCHISTSVTINGNCKIGNNTFIGSGVIVNNGVKIGNNCLVGSGLTIKKDMRDHEIKK